VVEELRYSRVLSLLVRLFILLIVPFVVDAFLSPYDFTFAINIAGPFISLWWRLKFLVATVILIFRRLLFLLFFLNSSWPFFYFLVFTLFLIALFRLLARFFFTIVLRFFIWVFAIVLLPRDFLR
jgi:hypothetical protein